MFSFIVRKTLSERYNTISLPPFHLMDWRVESEKMSKGWRQKLEKNFFISSFLSCPFLLPLDPMQHSYLPEKNRWKLGWEPLVLAKFSSKQMSKSRVKSDALKRIDRFTRLEIVP